jgi:hypothetical protein
MLPGIRAEPARFYEQTLPPRATPARFLVRFPPGRIHSAGWNKSPTFPNLTNPPGQGFTPSVATRHKDRTGCRF